MKKEIKVVMTPHNHDYILELKKNLEKKGITVTLLSPFHYATPSNILKLIKLKLDGYNILHIHFEYIFPSTFLMKVIIRFAKKLGYKVVWTIHDISKDFRYSNRRLRSREKAVWLYNNVDYRFVHYKKNIDRLKDCFGVKIENVEVIFHPCFDYENNISREDARKKLNIPSEKKVILSFGMIKRYKGYLDLVKAMAYLDDSYLCLIVGTGSQEPKTAKRIKEEAKRLNNVMVIDRYIPREEVQLYFNVADVIVLPYKDITQSGIIPLAYSFSKPVVATKVGAIPEMVKDGETGLLIPPNDVDASVNGIKKIFTMDYKKMGERAHKLAKEKFTWEKLAEQTIKVYEKVLENEDK